MKKYIFSPPNTVALIHHIWNLGGKKKKSDRRLRISVCSSELEWCYRRSWFVVVPVLLSAHSSARCSFHTSSWKRCFSKRPAWELTPHSFTLVLHGSEWLDFVLFKKLLFLVTVLSCFKWDYKEKQVVDYYNAVYRINKPWNAEFLFSVISCGLFFVVFFLKWPV